VSVLSWNIHGLTDLKRSSSEFTNILSSFDICFLFETWTKLSSNITLDGYLSFNFFRKFQHRNARRCSGGIAIYIKDHLKNGIEIIRNHYDTIIWIKLNHAFFNTARDIYICGSYIWGEDSPVYNTINVDLFDILENDITYFSEIGNVFITGDLNSRIGNKIDFIVHDTINTEHDDVDYSPDQAFARASIDKIQNSHGIKSIVIHRLSRIPP
jgi:exonuclease III